MILKGAKRGGAGDLARHLMKAENEHIEIHEIRGFSASTLLGAFREAEAVSLGTRCIKPLFALALSPPETERVPVEVFEKAIAAIEEKLGLVDQPRVVVFHEKAGRRHAHCVWSRIDAATMTAIDMPHFKLKLGDVSRALYRDNGWKMPNGLIDPALRDPLNYTRQEWFQAKQAGQDPRAIKAGFQQCRAASDSGRSLQAALAQRGYHLARGDRRAVVALDITGEVYALARWAGVKTKDVNARMGDPGALPSIPEVRQRLATQVRTKLDGFLAEVADDFAKAADGLEAERHAMVERHRAARRALDDRQEQRRIHEVRDLAARFRKGLKGLWDRVTGQHARIAERNAEDAKTAKARDREERQALVDGQLAERLRLQEVIRRERQNHTRTITHLQRDRERIGREVPQNVHNHADAPRRRGRGRE